SLYSILSPHVPPHTHLSPLSLHDALPISTLRRRLGSNPAFDLVPPMSYRDFIFKAREAALIISDSGGIQEEAPHLGTHLLVPRRSEEHTSELQSLAYLVCRLLLEKKKKP